MEPRFVSLDEVLTLHEKSIQRYGGTLGIEIRVVLRPLFFILRMYFFMGAGDFFDIAAAYAYHIAEGQCFWMGTNGQQRVPR